MMDRKKAIPTLVTGRVRLRPFTPADDEPMFHLMSGKDVMRYFPQSRAPSREQVTRMLARQGDHWRTHGYGWWAVEARADGALMGWCGLQFLPETAETEVGYLLGRDYWGRGLATEAVGASLDWGFANLDVDAIIVITHPENKASQRVAEKIGLTFARADHYFGMDCLVHVIQREKQPGTGAQICP